MVGFRSWRDAPVMDTNRVVPAHSCARVSWVSCRPKHKPNLPFAGQERDHVRQAALGPNLITSMDIPPAPWLALLT